MSNRTAPFNLLFISAVKCLILWADQYAISQAWRAGGWLQHSDTSLDRAMTKTVPRAIAFKQTLYITSEQRKYLTQTTCCYWWMTPATGQRSLGSVTHMLVLAVEVSHSPARPMISRPDESWLKNLGWPEKRFYSNYKYKLQIQTLNHKMNQPEQNTF